MQGTGASDVGQRAARVGIGLGNVFVVVAALVSLWGQDAAPLRAGLHRGAMSGQGLVVRAGQVADFAALVVNSSPRHVRVERASLIPAAGFRAPMLVGVVVGSPRVQYAGRGWPITDPDGEGRPLPAVVPPGRSWLNFGVRGATPRADYAVLGLALTYRDGATERTVNVWAPSIACVRISMRFDAACDASGDAVRRQVEIRAG